jgi:DNA recombination protein RmuC
MSKLSSGSGNLVGRVENIKKLGAKTTKELPKLMLEE